MKKNMIKLIIIAMATLLFGCNQGKTLDGTYVSNVNGRSLTFKPNGMAFETSGVNKFPEIPYTIEGKKIKLDGADILQLNLMQNGSIGSQSYGEMIKK